MPEASIVLKAYDEISGTLKTIDSNSAALNKELEVQQRKLQQLGERYRHFTDQSADLAGQAIDTKRAMDAAAKAFKKTGDAADRTNFTKLQTEYKDLTAAAKAYDDAAAKTRKAMRDTADTARKTGGSKNGPSMWSKLGQAGALSFIGDVAGQWGSSLAGSAFGSRGGSLFGGMLGGAGSGAAIGSMIAPGVGTAIGAVAGGALGLVQGGNQIFENKDAAFKTYVESQTEARLAEQEQTKTTGSALAAGRETDLISLKTMFGGQDKAAAYLEKMVDMANNTPFLYGDLMGMTKVLGAYGYNDTNILPVLKAIGDTGAAKGWSAADMSTVATAIGRMQSSGKASQEYLNMLNDRGVNAVGMLASAKGVEQGKMYDMISEGKVGGRDAVKIILDEMVKSFNGAMLEQSKTFSGMSSTVEGLHQEMAVAMGEGYNDTRKEGMEEEIVRLSGESGEKLKEANKAIGAFKAELENEKDRLVWEAIDEAMSTEEYENAKLAGDAAEMGRIIMEAKTAGINEYNATEGAQTMLESELALAANIRDNTETNKAYWDAGYRKGEQYSKGLGVGAMKWIKGKLGDWAMPNAAPVGRGGEFLHPHASGLLRVPYDNYPALLHEGERVLTAAEARAADHSGPGVSVTVTGNNFSVRSEADIGAIANRLADELYVRALADGGA